MNGSKGKAFFGPVIDLEIVFHPTGCVCSCCRVSLIALSLRNSRSCGWNELHRWNFLSFLSFFDRPLPLPIAFWSMFMRFNLPIYDPCCLCAIYNSYGHEYVNSCLEWLELFFFFSITLCEDKLIVACSIKKLRYVIY